MLTNRGLRNPARKSRNQKPASTTYPRSQPASSFEQQMSDNLHNKQSEVELMWSLSCAKWRRRINQRQEEKERVKNCNLRSGFFAGGFGWGGCGSARVVQIGHDDPGAKRFRNRVENGRKEGIKVEVIHENRINPGLSWCRHLRGSRACILILSWIGLDTPHWNEPHLYTTVKIYKFSIKFHLKGLANQDNNKTKFQI